MKKIEPTNKEIIEYLDCCYYSHWHKGVCECKSPNQFKSCYKAAKKRLMKIVFTEEEIMQKQKANAKAMLDIERALATFHGEDEE